MSIYSPFIKIIISKIIKYAIKKELGVDLTLILDNFEITCEDENVFVTAEVNANLPKDDVTNLLAQKLHIL